MSTKMSQKEYLKKYLSGGSDKKKKKKDKRAKHKATTVKIIDDDVHGENNLEIDEELLLTGEDAPQIVGIIDASGATIESKWKSIGGIKEEKQENSSNEEDMWGKKATDQLALQRKSPERRPAGTDQSPPRRTKVMGPAMRNADQSPQRKRSVGRNGDQSPPRRRSPNRVRRNSDQSPPRRQGRARQNSDQSPPRRRSPAQSKRDADQSPRRRHSSGRMRKYSDQSPQRRRSPGRSSKHSERSPPRRDSKHGLDLSPVRIKREKSSDQSPPRRRPNGNPFRAAIKVERPSPDNSPRRQRSRLDSDQSPARTKHERHSESPPPTHKPSAKMTKTLDGKRAGLQDAKTLKHETEERRRNEDKMFNKMSTDISGRDAEVQVRQSSSYRRRRKELEEDPEVQRKKAAHEQQKKELYDRWNKGLKQIEAYKAKMSDDQYEGSKPLARYSNDADLDEMLKQQERDDDPMLAYMRNKKKDQQSASNIPVMPKYKGSFPENRFGIPPGYRWDGVDRSSGYERKWFDVQNQKKALADEAYKYSTEDM